MKSKIKKHTGNEEKTEQNKVTIDAVCVISIQSMRKRM